MKNQKIPSIQIHAIKENPDGSMNCEIEYDQSWIAKVKSDLGKKRVGKKDIEKHFIDLLTKAVENVEGYDIKKY